MKTFSREVSPWYVTGLVETEGSFTFSRSGGSYNLYFSVRRTGDEPLLLALQDFFNGIGRIYELKGRPRGRRAHLFRVTRLDELPQIVAHFEAYPLQGRKRDVFAIWRQMVALKRDRYRRPDRDRLQGLAAELSAAAGPRNAS